MYTKEQKDKLTPEQLVTAERWEQEMKARIDILDKIQAGDSKSLDPYFNLLESITSHCEHGRSTLSSCMACEEIEKLLYGSDHEVYD